MQKITIKKLIKERVPLIYDGAMGTEIQKSNVTKDDFRGMAGCNEILNISRQDIITKIHIDYLEAGANIIETNTFGGNRLKLEEYGLGDKLNEINSAAVNAAHNAIEEYNGAQPCFISGSMGPTGNLLSSSDSSMNQYDFDTISSVFAQQAEVLILAGVDILLLETMQDLLEVRAAIVGINRICNKLKTTIPLQVQVTMDQTGHMLLGSDLSAFLGAVANFNPTVMGFNCSTGPAEMAHHVVDMAGSVASAISMIPNAGMPENVEGKALYRMDADLFANHLEKMVTKYGVGVVGGCCGTTPEHIQALATRLAGKKVSERSYSKESCFLSTGISGRGLHVEKRPFIIGERLNTQGSRKTKSLVLDNNYDELYHIAIEQIDKGAALLDICMAVNERDDESSTVVHLVQHLSERIGLPFCIDSTDVNVFKEALKVAPGSVLINSINLEHNGDKARKICALAAEFGCPVVALPIDDVGMAKSVERKLFLTEKILDLACGEFGLPRHFIYLDPLVFTLATGDRKTADAANESLYALTEIKKKFPGIRTVMGVSNVSFGLRPKARRIMNNLMLHHSALAGLDAAIFNSLHIDDITTYSKDIRNSAEALLFNKKEAALAEYVELFENVTLKPQSLLGQPKLNEISPKEQLRHKIINRDKRDLNTLIDTLLSNNKPQEILNTILLPAMAEVGDKMAKGEMILPFVLQAAETMKIAVTILEPHFKKDKMESKGKIILATVFGDVHDIGKNLVGSILKNQGYDVVDLGKQVSLDNIVASVKKEKPDAVGLSALLVTTSQEMGKCVREFDRQGFSVPIIIGGAAVNKGFANRISVTKDGGKYDGGVFFAKDAFAAVKVLNGKESEMPISNLDNCVAEGDNINTIDSIPVPDILEHGSLLMSPFYGTSEILTWNSEMLLNKLDKRKLYKGYWRAGRLDKDAYKKATEEEFDTAFELLKNEILENELLDPRGFYGYYPVIVDDTKLIVLSVSDFHTEELSIDFMRIAKRKGRSFADYFRSEGDIFSTQIVTIGPKLGERCRHYFQKEDKYTLGFYLNGIGIFLTETIANLVTREIQRGLGLSTTHGRRFSFGYRGLDDLSEQRKLFDLMCVEDRLNITLTEGFLMDPEHSTMGIFSHHLDATYF